MNKKNSFNVIMNKMVVMYYVFIYILTILNKMVVTNDKKRHTASHTQDTKDLISHA